MSKQITPRKFNLRVWQQEAFDKVLEHREAGQKDFLCVGTPGSGKTKFALRVAHHFLINGMCKRVVVVTPTKSLKRQWALAAAEFAGIDLDPDYNTVMGMEISDFHGLIATYSLIGQDKKSIQAQNTLQKPTLVILDEPHHMGETLNWGEFTQKAFEGAVFRLLLSGTPFRSDEFEIPFVKYVDRVSVSDYNYSYERSIVEGVCRPVFFKMFEGKMNWKVGSLEFEHEFKDWIEKDQESKRLRTALDPEGEFVADVIRAANLKLNEIRQTHKDAGAMAVAATVEHARLIAKVISEVTGTEPPVVVSDESKADNIIEDFKNNSDAWLVSVKMISEGVDIPRLRVGAYLTNVKAELYFRQLVGRFVRMLRHLEYQDAHIFMPKDKDFVKLAAEINIEREHALDEVEKSGAFDDSADKDLFGNEYTPALEGRFIPLGSEATDSSDIAMTVGITNGMKKKTIKMVDSDAPIFEQMGALRKRIGDLNKMFAVKQKKALNLDRPDWKAAHKIYIAAGGKDIKHQNLKELQQRVEFYRNLLKGLNR